MTAWLLKDNILQDDTTNRTIYKASLIKKFTVIVHVQKVS